MSLLAALVMDKVNQNNLTFKSKSMKTEAIKPGPKPKKEDGSLDKRRRVRPEKKEKYKPLKKHDHKKGD